MGKIIEHEGVKYRKVDRGAKVGDKVVVVAPDDPTQYRSGEVHVVTEVASDNVELANINPERRATFLWDEEYAVLEPLADASTTPTLPKLTDAKPGDTVRIVDVKDYTDEGYRAGDTFEVASVWGNRGGVYTVDGPSLYAEEFEVVRGVDELAASLEEAAQLAEGIDADNVKKPAHYTQGGVEVIEYIEQVTAGYSDGFVSYSVGNCLKYCSRAPFKHDDGGLEDLKKAKRYLEYAIARLEKSDIREV